MRVLLIESDSASAQAIELMLKSEGFQVKTTNFGDEGIALGTSHDYGLILLNLDLLDMDGLDALRALRIAGVATPILTLGYATSVEERVKTFSGGADAFLSLPFSKDEFIPRVQELIRKARGEPAETMRIGTIVIDPCRKRVEADGLLVRLTGKEYQVLEVLARRKDTVVTKQDLLDFLYGGMDEPDYKIIDVFICKLRKKLAEAADGKHHIETVWGRGYIMREPAGTPVAA